MAKHRGRKRRRPIKKTVSKARKTTQEPPQQLPHTSQQRMTTRNLWRLFGVFAVLVSFIASVYQIGGGPPWPVDPVIHFRDTSDGSSLILPFDIRNKSGLFSVPDVLFKCGIDLVIAEDSKKHSVVIRDGAFVNGNASIPAGDEIPYNCNAQDALIVRPNGTLSIYGSATELENKRHIVYEPPWTIKKMCIWVGGEYKLFVFDVTFTSKIFQWPAMPGSHQWQEGRVVGATAPEADEERRLGLVPGALQCSEAVRFPYMLVVDNGEAMLVLDPTQTWPPEFVLLAAPL
jgi:hypothetical protein